MARMAASDLIEVNKITSGVKWIGSKRIILVFNGFTPFGFRNKPLSQHYLNVTPENITFRKQKRAHTARML